MFNLKMGIFQPQKGPIVVTRIEDCCANYYNTTKDLSTGYSSYQQLFQQLYYGYQDNSFVHARYNTNFHSHLNIK